MFSLFLNLPLSSLDAMSLGKHLQDIGATEGASKINESGLK